MQGPLTPVRHDLSFLILCATYVPFWVKGGYLDTSCDIRDIIINSQAYHSLIASVLTEQPMFLTSWTRTYLRT